MRQQRQMADAYPKALSTILGIILWRQLPTAPCVVSTANAAESRRASSSVRPHPPEHKADVPSGVHIPVPSCLAIVALQDSIQGWIRMALGITFSLSVAKLSTLHVIIHPFSTIGFSHQLTSPESPLP